MPLHLVSVDEHSPAQRLGLEPGCTLLAIDGNPLNDALDYQFYTSAPHFTLTIFQNGAQQQISVEKGEYEPFGCNFKTYLGDEKHSCANHCMFCFIDQLPPGMREPLYFKDDDERLSFLYGNYITMTNLTAHYQAAYQPYFHLGAHHQPPAAGTHDGKQARSRNPALSGRVCQRRH